MSPSGDRGPGEPIEVAQGVDEDRVVVHAGLDLSLADQVLELTEVLQLRGVGRADRP